jgi:signal transduction histidine kinase/ligand-binding sensor domain-containing protein
MKLRRLLVLIALVAATMAAAASGPIWSLRRWQSGDGLPNNTITGLAQTRDGYLWIASPGPLVRFDGNTFEKITPSQIVSQYHQNARALLCASDGSMWIATAHGPIFRIATDNAVEVFTNNLPDMIVQRLMEDADGDIWMFYTVGEIRRIHKGMVQRFSTEDGWSASYGALLTVDGKGRVWSAEGGVLGQFSDGRFKSLLQMDTLQTQIAGANNGGVWICIGSELFKCDDGKTLRDIGAFQTGPSAAPTVLFESRHGDLWIGTAKSGLFCYNTEGFQRVSPYLQILSIAEDREGNIWVGTGGDGLVRIRPSVVRLENEEDQSSFGIVRSICEDTNGTLWAATDRGRLIQRSNGQWNGITNWPGESASCVASDGKGNVWVAARDALYCGNGGHWRQVEQLTSMSERVYALAITRQGDLWVAGSTLDNLRRLHEGRWHTLNLPPSANYIRAMAEDAAGNIWAGTSRGVLLRLRDDAVFDETTNVFGIPTSVRGMWATPDGIWIASAGRGLFWINQNGRASRIVADQGLYDNYLSQVIADGHGWLWLGSDHGIFKAGEQALEAVAEGRAPAVQCVRYDQSAGLPSLEAGFGRWPGVLRSRDGLLWMPMKTALSVIDPRAETERPSTPPVYLTQVLVDGEVAAAYGGIVPARAPMDLSAPGNVLRLPPKHYRLEFNYTAIDFSDPENVNFRYGLEGFENGWIDAGSKRAADFSRLPAGDYRFKVQARIGDGDWSPGVAMAVSVSPFLWQTWWFRLTALLAFTGALIGIVRYISFQRLRHRLQMLERQAVLDRERARIARDIHDDLGGSLTQIALLSGLGQRDRADSKKVDEYIRRISATTHRVIQVLDEVVWAVNPRHDNVRDFLRYVGQFAVDFLSSAGIKCRLNLPENIPPSPISSDLRHHLFMVSKEALNNIVKHARAGEVHLSADIDEGSVTLTIEDDGRGFDQRSRDAFADGLGNMRQRMQEAGGHCEIESVPGRGTRVIFRIAVNRNALPPA